jgi:pyruvate dehydrogenase E2 component (dihydrolipoamide acetyltransferase)
MARVEVQMPKMGESITEGTVLTWHKQPGDFVELDETLLEIGTDKVDTEVPSPAAGVVEEILVAEGDTVDVGTIVAVLETEKDAASASEKKPAAPPAPEAKPEPSAIEGEKGYGATGENKAAREAEAAPSKPSSSGKTIDVVMPKMGESIVEGTILTWHKQPGDKVELDETLLEIATDKVDTEVPSPAAGTVIEILVPEGETVEVGARIAVIGTGEMVAASPSPQPQQGSEGDSGSDRGVASEASAVSAEPSGPIPRKTDDGKFFSPLVRSIAEAEGISLDELRTLEGSGREGRITKQDVMDYLERRGRQPAAPSPAQKEAPTPAPAARPSQPAARPAPSAPAGNYGDRVEIVEMDRMRQIISEHMVRSKSTSAHVTTYAECDVTNLVRFREGNKDSFLRREGVKLTYTPFFVHAAAQTLREHPVVNSSVDGTRIILKKDIHIGIAVAIGKTGLVAPVIRDAGDKNVNGIARVADDLAQRARSKQLQPNELQGGTFTVTNIGSLGSLMGTPIINQPQVAIMAVGAIKKRPMVIEDPVHGDVIAIRHMMYVSLSYDHRIIDGAMGSSFLQRFVQLIEQYDPNGEL